MANKKKKSNDKKIITSKLKNNDNNAVAYSDKQIEKKTTKEKKSSSTENEEDLISDLRIIYSSKELSRSTFSCYAHIPAERRITKDTDIGSRVIVAKYPAFYKIYFMEYIDAGQPHFPHGGIKVYNATYEQAQYFYYESVAIHPTKHDIYRVKNIDE